MSKAMGFLLAGALALSGYGEIVTNYWVATGSGGNWDTAANWSRGVVPDTNTVAILTNVVSGRYAVEVDGADCKAWRVICGSMTTNFGVNLNIRTKLSAVNAGGTVNVEDYSFRVDGFAYINIYSNAVLDSYQKLNSSVDTIAGVSNIYYIAKGGILKVASANSGKGGSLSSGLIVEGEIQAFRNGINNGNYGVKLYTGATVTNVSSFTIAGIATAPTVITGNTLITGGPVSFSGGSVLLMYSGILSNALTTSSSDIGVGAGGNASTFANFYGGTWYLNNPLQVCVRPVGYLNLLGVDARIISSTNVYVGSRNPVGGGGNSIIGYYGYINVSNGLFKASNPAGKATLYLGNITGGFFNSIGGTSEVDNVLISCLATNDIGRLTINGGVFTAGTSFIATNGTNSAVSLLKGKLSLANARISNGSVFSVGGGTGSAELGLLAGTHSFANGIVVSNTASLMVKASSQLTGNIEFKTGSGIGGQISNGQLGTLRVIGTVTVPSVLAKTLVSTDGSTVQSGVLVEADAISGSANVERIAVGDSEYLVRQDGNFIRVSLIPQATLIRLY